LASTLTGPRWTHIALPCRDIDASVEWYRLFTPLVVLARHEDEAGRSAWLCHEGQVDTPFVLVLAMFHRDAGRPRPTMAPFAHIGIELPDRAGVDEMAGRARAAGCLHWEPADLPPPVGYVCAATDPDGNIVEFSHDQGVYAAVEAAWGAARPAPPGPAPLPG
jgi:catechol 2,3-dioxygenase-like lactoylglutathione lyase family enzyme